MTFGALIKIFEENNIPNDVVLLSDSGWECSETDMDGVYYSPEKNIVVFTQEFSEYETIYTKENGYIELRRRKNDRRYSIGTNRKNKSMDTAKAGHLRG